MVGVRRPSLPTSGVQRRSARRGCCRCRRAPGGERLEPGRAAHEVVDLLVVEPDEDAGGATERRAEEERRADDLADIYAENLRRAVSYVEDIEGCEARIPF